jgi:hypothetical protein
VATPGIEKELASETVSKTNEEKNSWAARGELYSPTLKAVQVALDQGFGAWNIPLYRYVWLAHNSHTVHPHVGIDDGSTALLALRIPYPYSTPWSTWSFLTKDHWCG